ncbi:MAG TPA: hypothetical protein VKD00_06445 [Methyloceanibacter sp.]|nr:hypothetical protein [Methyloceanibacter sp.]
MKRMTVRELQMAEGKPYGVIAEHLQSPIRPWPIPAPSSRRSLEIAIQHLPAVVTKAPRDR